MSVWTSRVVAGGLGVCVVLSTVGAWGYLTLYRAFNQLGSGSGAFAGFLGSYAPILPVVVASVIVLLAAGVALAVSRRWVDVLVAAGLAMVTAVAFAVTPLPLIGDGFATISVIGEPLFGSLLWASGLTAAVAIGALALAVRTWREAARS